MKTNKLLSLFFSFLLVFSLFPLASAGSIAAFSYWIDTSQADLEVIQGALPQFAVLVESYQTPLDITVEIWQNGQLIRTLLEVKNYYQQEYYNLLTLNTAGLSGDYQIITTAKSPSDLDLSLLNLKVKAPTQNNHLPEIISAPVLEVKEKENYQYYLEVLDSDNDALIYSFVQTPTWINGQTINNNKFLVSGLAPEVNENTNYAVTIKISDGKDFVTQTFAVTVKDSLTPPQPQPTQVSVLMAWSSSNTKDYTVNSGSSAQFVYTADSLGENYLGLAVNLFKNGVLQETLVEASTLDSNYQPTCGQGSLCGAFILDTEIAEPGTYTLEAVALGASGAQDKDTLTLTVIGDYAPVFQPVADQAVNEGQTLTLSVIVNDRNNNPLNPLILSAYQKSCFIWDWFCTEENLPAGMTYTYVSDSASGNGKLVFTPPYTFISHTDSDLQETLTIVVTAWDGRFEVEEEFLVTVKDVNQLPAALERTLTTPKNVPVEITLQGTDLDLEDSLFYTIKTQPAYGTLRENQNSVTYTPATNYAGTDSFTFTVTDSLGAESSPAAVTISIRETNQAPILSPIGNKQVALGQTLSFTLSARDPDGDTLTYSVSNLPSVTLNSRTGAFSWTPTQIGNYPVTFKVSDGSLEASETITIVVTTASGQSNTPVKITSSPLTEAVKDKLYSYQVKVLNQENDKLVYSLTQGPVNMVINQNGLLTWTPKETGRYCLALKVAEESTYEKYSDSQNFCLEVSDAEEVALKFSQLNLLSEIVSAGDNAQLAVTLLNDGKKDLEDLKITTLIYDLGLRKSTTTFDLDRNDKVYKQLLLEIPADVEPGEYELRIVASNGEVTRVVHRFIEVIE